MADAKVTDLTELSVPALEDVMYIVDDPSGTPASRKVVGNRLMGMLPVVPGGRLTLTSGTSVTTSDVTGAGTLYYTPDVHNLIRLYDGTRWKLHTFTERSLALTLTASRAYDVFIYDNAGTLTLELSAAWNSDGTTRTDALTTQDGVKVARHHLRQRVEPDRRQHYQALRLEQVQQSTTSARTIQCCVARL
jgi:hypothetical protein